MRYLIIILFLILINCKNETKSETASEPKTEMQTENGIDESVYEMWNNFTKSNPEFKKEELPQSDFFHDNKEDADRLAELTLNGKKKASSGLYAFYKKYNIELPKVGNKQIITDFDGKAKAIIETKSVDTIPFNKISREYAVLDMGTNIEPLEKWKKAHWEFFENFMKEIGEKPTEDMLLWVTRLLFLSKMQHLMVA